MLLEIRQKAAPATHELQQSASRIVVLRVCAQVPGQVVDPLRQQGDLNLGRARVRVARPVLGDDLLFDFLRKAHPTSVSSVPATRRKQAESRGCGRRTG